MSLNTNTSYKHVKMNVFNYYYKLINGRKIWKKKLYIYHNNKLNKKKKKEDINKYSEQFGIFHRLGIPKKINN